MPDSRRNACARSDNQRGSFGNSPALETYYFFGSTVEVRAGGFGCNVTGGFAGLAPSATAVIRLKTCEDWAGIPPPRNITTEALGGKAPSFDNAM